MRRGRFIIKARLSIAFAAVLSGMAMQASAHHSGAMFDADKILTMNGSVKEFQWTNPHCWIQLVVLDEHGAATEWSIEGPAPGTLSLLGWHRSSLKVGDKVTVKVHPLKSGESGGGLVGAILADGTSLSVRPMPPGGAEATSQPRP